MADVIRAIPNAVMGPHPWGERYFTTKGLTWKQQTELKDELVGQGCLVQEIFLADPMNVLIERRVRAQIQDEQEAKE